MKSEMGWHFWIGELEKGDAYIRDLVYKCLETLVSCEAVESMVNECSSSARHLSVSWASLGSRSKNLPSQ
jgi:hypothetical protein